MHQQTLQQSMAAAWQRRADEAAHTILTGAIAPALVKPEAVDTAEADYVHAMREVARWSR